MHKHIVIAGQGRSGSTLFYNMMGATLQGYRFYDQEVPAVQALAAPGNGCTKRPYDIFQAPQIVKTAAQYGKSLELIVMLRDPRDILTSRHQGVKDDYFYAADHAYFISDNAAPSFTSPGFLPVHKAILDVTQSGIFTDGIFFLKYEELVENPEAIQALLAEQMGLTFKGSFRDFNKREIPEVLQRPLNGVRDVETSRRRKWKAPEHHARIVEQFTRFPVLHDVLISLGYEKDQSWFAPILAAHEARQAAAI